jgi:hypothetical protein
MSVSIIFRTSEFGKWATDDPVDVIINVQQTSCGIKLFEVSTQILS